MLRLVALPAFALVFAFFSSVAPGQTQFAELGKLHLPQESDDTSAVAVGDVDGDGDLDLVVGNYFGQQNRLYLNDGRGTFTDATASRMPTDRDPTRAVALSDVDSDGDLDLVCGNSGQGNSGQQNRLYLNDGKGTFTDVTVSRMPTDSDYAWAVAVGDVDGDGDLDLVFGNAPGQNRLYLNDGKGTFTDATASRLPKDSGALCVALGDVDGDGDLDLVFGSGQNRLYLNDGKGTFTDATASRMPQVILNTYAVALGDVDGDGDLDLVFGNLDPFLGKGQQNRLYLNDGKGTFTDATATRLPKDSDNTYAVAVGDVDGDRDLDMVCGNRGQNRLYLNDGKGTFTDATVAGLPKNSDSTVAVAVGDVDGDRDLDMVCGNWGQNRLSLNDGKGTFTDATAIRMPEGGAWAVALRDVDGDGDLDLVWGNGGQNRLYLNDGQGKFTDATASRMPMDSEDTNAVALGDVDGDGDLDLVCGNFSVSFGPLPQQNRLYLNDGKGTFTDATATRLPTVLDMTATVALGDVDRDGDLDLLFGNYREQNRLYLNDGKGKFTDATTSRLPNDTDDTVTVALDDVDSDRDLDLVCGNEGQNRLYLNDGNGTFTDVTASHLPRVSDITSAVALGDVDGDRDLDLVFGNSAEQNRLYLNDGKGTFTDATAHRLPKDSDGTGCVALGDVDGDRDLDLVFGNSGSPSGGQNRLYLNDGKGTFTDATTSRLPKDTDNTYAVALGDVDGDADLDMVFGNVPVGGKWPNRLYLNLHRQIHAPRLAIGGRDYQLDFYAKPGYASATQYAVPFLNLAPAVPAIQRPPFGTIGVSPVGMAMLPQVSVPAPAGKASTKFKIPASPVLVGLTGYVQALMVHGVTPLEAHFTNVVADRIIK